MRANLESVFMLIDPNTREAYRGGAGGAEPWESGPLFFTSEAAAEHYAAEAGLGAYELYSVPAGVLDRLKGKPHWVDGKPQSSRKQSQSRVKPRPDGGRSE